VEATRRLGRPPRAFAVLDKKMSVTPATHREDAAAVEAYTSRVHRGAEAGERAGRIGQER
jgi:hypothetical protein